MSNPTDRLNEEQPESLLDNTQNEHEFEGKAVFSNRSVTGGKGPGFVSESENE